MIYGKGMDLRPYQINSIQEIRKHLALGKKRLLLVAPTGSGKTVVASHLISEAIKTDRFSMFVAHRRELVNQCSRKLKECKIGHGIVMADKPYNSNTDVQIVSIQTFAMRKDNEDFIKPKADLIILDEAHRSVSNSFQSLIKQYPNADLIIGLTATPVRQDGKGLGNIYEHLIECGSIKELTQQGYLVKNRIVAPTMPDLVGLKMIGGDYDLRGLEQRMNKPKLVGDIVSHWIQYGENRPTIAFASSVAHSKYIRNIFNENNIPAGHIDGEMNETDREEQLQLLQDGEIKVLSNCMVLTEGWDQPLVSCCILARPTKSYPLYIQMIGRTLRPYPGKENTLIIDHSGAVYQHGFPEDAGNWTLKMTKKRVGKKKKTPEPIEQQPMTCTQCYTVFKLSRELRKCPNCGFVPTKRERVILIKQGRLQEMPRMKHTSSDKSRFYAELLFYAKQKGYNSGWASHTFRTKFGHFPHNKKVFPISTGDEVKKFIQYCNIRRAMRSRNFLKKGVA